MQMSYNIKQDLEKLVDIYQKISDRTKITTQIGWYFNLYAKPNDEIYTELVQEFDDTQERLCSEAGFNVPPESVPETLIVPELMEALYKSKYSNYAIQLKNIERKTFGNLGYRLASIVKKKGFKNRFKL